MTEQLDFATCMRLMKAGFPRQGAMYQYPFNRDLKGEPLKVPGTRPVMSCSSPDYCACPTTDELIRELGEEFGELVRTKKGFEAVSLMRVASDKSRWQRGMPKKKTGKTPLEAVKNLYLELNEKAVAAK